MWGIWFPVALLSPFVLTTLAEGSAAGATVGKRALRLRVVPADGRRRVGWGRAAGRSLARLLSAAPLLLGYFACLWDRQHRTWHDHLSRTVVLELPAQPVVLPEPDAAPAADVEAAVERYRDGAATRARPCSPWPRCSGPRRGWATRRPARRACAASCGWPRGTPRS